MAIAALMAAASAAGKIAAARGAAACLRSRTGRPAAAVIVPERAHRCMALAHRRGRWDPRLNVQPLICARTYACACCMAEVLVCPGCDRGQRYCGKACRLQARRATQRIASKKYQDTRAGRINHARRQRRYRDQARDAAPEIVTHQGSPQVDGRDLLQSEPNGTAVVAPQAGCGRTCRWCARPVTGVVRRGWLRHAVLEQEIAHEPQGSARAQPP